MVFYEDFVKKIKGSNKIKLEEKHRFGANINKIVSNCGIGIPLLMLGSFELYNSFVNSFSIRTLVGFFLLFYGFVVLYNVFSYKFVIDTKELTLKDKKINIDLNKVKLCELAKRAAPGGKRLEACLSFYTEDKQEIVLPLIMNKKLQFVLVMQELLQDRFEIIEDK